MSEKSPEITKVSWGKIEIENYKIFKDVKLFPGGCRAWNWRETGTNHSPGIQYSDVTELMENGAKEVVLSRGVVGRLKVDPKTLKKLESDNIIVHMEKTREAIKIYNKLRKTKQVGALIHTTC